MQQQVLGRDIRRIQPSFCNQHLCCETATLSSADKHFFITCPGRAKQVGKQHGIYVFLHC